MVPDLHLDKLGTSPNLLPDELGTTGIGQVTLVSKHWLVTYSTSTRNVEKYFTPKSTESSRSAGTVFRSYLDVLRELEAENYTMRIAAKRSFSKYRLEGPNP